MEEQNQNESLETLKYQCAELAERLADAEEKNRLMQDRIDRIENNPLYKASKPLRQVRTSLKQTATRLKNQGSLGGVLRKIKMKQSDQKARKRYGLASFPSQEVILAEGAHVFANPVVISILTPLYNTPERFLRELIESVMNQTYGGWEFCLADGSDEEHAYVERIVREYMEKDAAYLTSKAAKTIEKIAGGFTNLAGEKGTDATSVEVIKKTDGSVSTHPLLSRIKYKRLTKNRGISENTNECLTMATGSYIGLLDHDDLLHPEILYLYMERINEEGSDYLYCDETTFSGASIDHMINMHFKPDFAPDNLRANNYICHFSVFKKELLRDDKMLDSRYDGSQDHELILRLTDRATHITHVPRILYYWRSHAQSTASGIQAKTYAIDSAKRAVSDHLKRHGYKNFRITSTRAFETIFKISYEITDNPKITLVVPSRDESDSLKRLLDSVLEKSTYRNYDIVVVENHSKQKETFDFYETCQKEPYAKRVQIVTAPAQETFNFSELVNYGVEQADGEYIVLLNNDCEVLSPNWMEEMLMYAQREDVGAVGVKLLFPDRLIQHGSVILGLGAHRTAGHSHYGMAADNLGYMGRLCYAQDVSAVTGACLMVAKDKYQAVKGFDPTFAVSLNDVDFCLRLREKGWLNIFTPFAILTHYESLSRGLDDNGQKAERYNQESAQFRNRWKEVLSKGDPYYNINQTLNRSDFSLKTDEELAE